jgi:hypothetical protein
VCNSSCVNKIRNNKTIILYTILESCMFRLNVKLEDVCLVQPKRVAF